MLPPVISERQPLSVGAPPAQKALGAVFGVLFASAGAAFTLLPYVVDGWLQRAFGADESCPAASEVSGIPPELLPPSVRECIADGSWFAGAGGVGAWRLIGLLGIPFMLLGLYLAAGSLRTAAWLEGTRVTVRTALRSRTVDLATATVTPGATTYRRTAGETTVQAPALTAQDPGSGRRVTVALHGGGLAQLPGPQLRALADALDGNADPDARSMAVQLRTMAEHPLGLTNR